MRNFQKPGKSTVYSTKGMVATSHPIASSVGLDILRKGGNAVDAAIAMAFVLPMCEPQSTGLFGDVFAMVKPNNSENIIGLNGSGRAPLNVTSKFLKDKNFSVIPEDAVETITMPGAVAALESLNKKFSKMNLDALIEPAISYAQNGIVVSPRVAFDWKYSYKNLKGIAKDYYLINGKPYVEGSIFKSPGQAEVLKKISEKGSKGFYEGEVAKDFIDSLTKLGGVHSYSDLNSVSVEYVEPYKANFGSYDLFEMPPNSQGITAILILKILQKIGISRLDPMGSERVHIEAEAAKIAYKARNNFIGDPNFYGFDNDLFFSDENINKYVSWIKKDKVNSFKDELNFTPHKDTVFLTVVDENRLMISLIFSIFNSFGSGYASEKYGILFHNRGAGFCLNHGHPNELNGGKRPLHTILPGFLMKKNDFIMPFGVMGGQYQANGHARLISNIVDYGMDIQEAIDFPRSFPESGFLKLEDGYSEIIAKELIQKGHKITRPDQPIGGAQAIIHNQKSDTLIGGSDSRKDGCALGH